MEKLLFLYENCQKFVYRISDNESLFDLCMKFKVSPQRIIKINGLSKNPAPNSLIVIEKLQKTFIYQVMPGDTLDLIEQRFYVSKQQILTQNCIEYIFPFQLIEI